jgi:two-component system, chemotaxis family, protein-glutamate methylesterase/glutaminase
MRKVRVLVVDDSVVIRRMLTDVFAGDPDIELAGVAANGRIALAKLPQINPDLVTLDIEMPELDGLGTLPELRKLYPKLPVIMFSTLTERGAVATLEALSKGATDYVTKPANVGSVAVGIQRVRDELLPKIKALCRIEPPSITTAPPQSRRLSISTARKKTFQKCEIVVIGSSTGGPQALTAVLRKLPANFAAPIVVVQHMPPVFTNHLANRLNQDCALEVVEATGTETLRAGQVLIAPGDFHLELKRQGVIVTTVTNRKPPENSCRPAVDVLFRSAASIFGGGCLGVVLTGMGQDGLRGSEAIVDAGGSIIAQDEATSVVWGMPRAVAQAGIASRVLPLQSVADEMTRLTALGRNSVDLAGAAK